MSITVCIIAKDEAKKIGNCLKSIENFADEIIVVDTGSNDNTVEIAKSYGAKVIYTNFDYNFSKARNIALDNATKDWILNIDCDEMLQQTEQNVLKDILNNSNIVACCLKLINVIYDKEYQGPYVLRLFRNNKGFRYEGRIHEQILKSIYVEYDDDNIINCDINLYHYGYGLSIEEMKKKHIRNIKIFNSYTLEEKDGFFYFNLANEYFGINSFEEARKQYLEALKHINNEVNFREFIPSNLLRCYYELGLYEKGIEVANSLQREFYYLRDIYFLKAALYRAIGRSIEAKSCYERYLALSESTLSASDNHFDSFNDIKKMIKSLSN